MNLTNEKKVVWQANKFLLEEMKKRWPMIYNRRVQQCYVALLPNGCASHLQITCYASGIGKYVLRLTDVYEPVGYRSLRHYDDHCYSTRSKKKDAPYVYGSFKRKNGLLNWNCEVTFVLEEMEKIITWALDNYIEVKELHEDMDWEFHSEHYMGKPLHYIRSKKTAQHIEIIYKNRKKQVKKESQESIINIR